MSTSHSVIRNPFSFYRGETPTTKPPYNLQIFPQSHSSQPSIVASDLSSLQKALILYTMIKGIVSSIPISISHQFSNLSVVSQWNHILREAVNQSQYQKTLILFHQMMQKGLQPNHLTLPIIAKACGKLNNIRYSEIIHGQIIKSPFATDLYVQTAMMDAYVKCDCMNIARKVFDRMPQRDIACWNALLLGLAQLGVGEQVLLMFRNMRVERVQPDSVTVIGVSQSIKGREGVWVLKAVHAFGIRIGVELDVSVSNTWVSSYAKVRDLDSAEKVFYGINPVFITVVSWNSMIAGYAYFHKYLKAISFYKKMLCDGFKPDLSTNLNLLSSISQHEALFHGSLIHCHGIKTGCDLDITILNTLISMYSKCNNLNAARQVFDNMMNKTCVSWTAMIGGYAEKGDLDEALTLFNSMEASGVKPDLVTILNLIGGCGETGALEIGKWVENYAVLNGFSNNLMVLNALIDMYAKCGSLKEAREIFYKMRERTVVSWTSMISGCALNGEFEESLTHFFHMLELGIKPNHITFLAVLQACNHGGFIKKGWEIYDLMTKVYKIHPGLDHYSSMADLLARGGKINEALDFIKNMPLEPDVGIWSLLLSACKVHHNVEIGELAAHCLFEMDPQAAAPYVEMANIYASIGCWDGVMDVRRLMKMNQVKKFPGESIVQVSGKSFKFTVEDRCHPKGASIYEVLDGLALQLKDELDVSNLEDGNFRSTPMQPKRKDQNIIENVIELSSSESEDENTPSCNDSNQQLVLYDPSVNGGSVAEDFPCPVSYKPPPVKRILPAVGAFTVQCANCFKWRFIPTKEKYEEIREHIIEKPFVCASAHEWRPGVSCDDPPDIEQDGSRIWAIDKPNIAQPPPGWQRDLRIRGEGGTKFADIYYTPPTGGKVLRSIHEVGKYLIEHPEYVEQGVTLAQFSFQVPKPLREDYIRKRPSSVAELPDGNSMRMPEYIQPSPALPMPLPDPDPSTDLQLAINPLPKKARIAPGNPRHNFD
ncbi:hypothetical protein L1987_14416 [Smallanthus sonchifolius]|uniref:Uncharacterized protein n=1 Tax=Smallanthus sonchifolius TaxID=185202 RepID=A0ACB9J3T1_9ASTR|nr:hypothetical protein L1987_14416 [Smallanthus sonchifolius]